MKVFYWYTVLIFIGVALDWAILDRLCTTLDVILKKEARFIYIKNIFPRFLITIPSLFLIAYGTDGPINREYILVLGIFLFTLSLIFGLFLLYKNAPPAP
jgi:hypothetical protein